MSFDDPAALERHAREKTRTVRLDAWEVTFLLDILGPAGEMAVKTKRLRRKLVAARVELN